MRKSIRRPRLPTPLGIASVLSSSGEQRFSPRKEPIALGVWQSIVGIDLAARARVISIDRGTLLLRVATSTWANELSFLEGTLKERLTRAGIQVERVRFQVGPLEAPMRLFGKEEHVVPQIRPLPPEVARAVGDVEDPTLRDVLREAAQANLAWNTARERAIARDSAQDRQPLEALETLKQEALRRRER